MGPVLNLPLQRVRQANPPPRATSNGAGAANATIEHVSITGGTVVFSNLRDRVENRIETINADATIGSDRKIVVSGSARAAERPLKFEIKVTAPAPPIERQNVPTEFAIDAPGLLQAPVSGRAELRLNGSVVMINGLSGTLGDGTFNGWASVDIASKPLVKLDLDFQRLTVATSARRAGGASQPWSNASIDLNGLNYVDAQARISAAEIAIGDGAVRAGSDRGHARKRRLEGKSRQSRRLWRQRQWRSYRSMPRPRTRVTRCAPT